MKVFWVVFALCLAVQNANGAPPPVNVFVVTVQQSLFSNQIEALGTLRSNEAITLTAKVTDTVSAIHFSDGQRVKQNDILLEMTNDEEHALLQKAQFELQEAKRQYQRVQTLAKTNLATESLLDEREQIYQSAQTQFAAMQSRMRDRIILAPFTGVLGLRNISVGTLVRPGDPITTLDDDSIMKLDISMPSVLIQDVMVGMPIQAHTKEFGDKVFSGKVTAIGSRVDPDTRSITLRAEIANPDFVLKPGLLMTATLKTPEQPRLLLPEESIVREGYQSFVYRIKNDTAHKIPVQTGARSPGYVVVTDGIEEGDQIVTHGVLRLRDGAKVVVRAQQVGDEPLADLLSGK